MSEWRFLRWLLRGGAPWTGTAYLLLALTWVAAIGLLALSGWFITAAALAGAGLLQGLDLFTPSAGIRAAALLRTLARYGERVLGHEATLRVLARLRGRSFAAISRLPIAVQQQFRSGDLQQRLTADIDLLDAVPLRLTGPVTAAILALAGAALLAGWLAPWPAPLLLLGTGALTLALSALAARLGEAGSRDIVARRSRQRVALLDFFGGLAELLAYRRAGVRRAFLEELEHALAARLLARERFAVLAEQAVQWLVGLASLLMLFLALRWYASGEISAPVLVLLSLMSLGLGEALGALPGAAWRVGESLQAGARLRALGVAPGCEGPVQVAAVADGPVAGAPCLRAQELRVGFHGHRSLLQDLNFTLEPGLPLVIHGPSGVGKSSLLATVAGELPARGGTVMLAGRPLASRAEALRYRLVGYLPQETTLLDDTVAANLRLGRPELGDDALWQALSTVDLAPALERTAAGLSYGVGEGGRRLSGGQARRLALARLILRNPPVALLDEPFSSLDRETEQRVLAAMLPWFAQRCAVLVTHAPERLPAAWPRLHLSTRQAGHAGAGMGAPFG